MNTKVLKASAGTGKTYRLSMEFLNILLNHQFDPEFSFKNILVITFTKKATAEIRTAVFERLHDIIIEQKIDKLNYLEKLAGRKLNDNDLSYLKHSYETMLIQKDLINISTIDSFINTIFKTLIAPIINISNYQVFEVNSDDIYEKCFDLLLKHFPDTDVISFMKRLQIRNKKDMIKYFQDLLSFRFLNYFIKADQLFTWNASEADQRLSETRQHILRLVSDYLDLFAQIVSGKISSNGADGIDSFLTSFIKNLLKLGTNISYPDFQSAYMEYLNTDEFFEHDERFISFLEKLKFWDGRKIREKGNEDIYRYESDLLPLFRDYFNDAFLYPEIEEILAFWDKFLSCYDEIKMNEKKFTFDDLLWYTYVHLFTEDHQLLSPQNQWVNNEFYEALCMNIQYVLIDEFQDTGIMQFNVFKPILAELLSGSGRFNETGIIIVGDEKQSIYEWRGGERSLLSQMTQYLNLEAPEDLKVCFRSNAAIINLINQLFHTDHYRHLFSSPDQQWFYDADITANDLESPSGIMTKLYQYKRSIGKSNLPDDLPEENTEQMDENEEEIINQGNTKINSYKSFVKDFVIPALNPEYYAQTAIIARTNEDLIAIEAELIKYNIPSFRQSSSSLFEHPAIVSIMALIKYIAYNDWKSLLILLRSDLFLISAQTLKDYADQIDAFYKNKISTQDLLDFLHQETDYQRIKEISEIYNTTISQNQTFSIVRLIDLIIQTLSMNVVFIEENQLKNLYQFMEICQDFDLHPAPFVHSLDGFLQHIEQLMEGMGQKQSAVKLNHAVELLTIHKSKGLTYHTVFVYQNISSNQFPKKSLYFYQFSKQRIGQLSQWQITNKYRKAVLTFNPDLKNQIKMKEYIEELNNTYVALTRAVQNLGIFTAMPEIAVNKSFNTDRPLTKMASLLFSEDSENLIDNTAFVYPEIKEETPQQNFYFKGTHLLKDNAITVKSTEDSLSESSLLLDNIQKRTKAFTENQSALKGSVIHDYLSHIFYNTDQERQWAKQTTHQAYGNLLSSHDIEQMIKDADSFIDQHPEVYSKEWDKVLNEYSIFTDEQTFRIDRLMMNSKDKIIKIIDYKTGRFGDEQIQNYKSIIQKLAERFGQELQIETEYMSIDLSN